MKAQRGQFNARLGASTIRDKKASKYCTWIHKTSSHVIMEIIKNCRKLVVMVCVGLSVLVVAIVPVPEMVLHK